LRNGIKTQSNAWGKKMNEIQVGLIGLGTVGCGLVKVLEDNREML
jgi:phosphoglycerate dehydrogenase-like enzyme